ncbi:MAG: hypothetical protein LBV02_06885, partial [Bacteroidales bacterium]|nr:hypothetical protein [Bacteroidales bacterium]
MKNRKPNHLPWKTLSLRLLSVLSVFIICKLFFFLFNKPVATADGESGGFLYWVNLIRGIIRYDLSA